jgi:4-carboxymuconolactone decarboxylase
MGDGNLYDRGMAVRREVLGDEYVDRVTAEADEHTQMLQEYATEHVWAATWGRPGLDRRTRSLVTIGMMAAINRPHELGLHLGGALRNGCTREEIREVLLQVAGYCGAPAAVDAFRVMREVFADDATER